MASPRPPEPGAVALGPRATAVRRAVGPIAWAVLECLAESREEVAGETVSHASVRGIADALGLAKDTVARALRRIADAGLVAYVASRSEDGRFAASHYRLSFPTDLFLDPPNATAANEPTRPARPTRPTRPPATTQLSLIDTGPTAT